VENASTTVLTVKGSVTVLYPADGSFNAASPPWAADHTDADRDEYDNRFIKNHQNRKCSSHAERQNRPGI
jgi:hypothetical protein